MKLNLIKKSLSDVESLLKRLDYLEDNYAKGKLNQDEINEMLNILFVLGLFKANIDQIDLNKYKKINN